MLISPVQKQVNELIDLCDDELDQLHRPGSFHQEEDHLSFILEGLKKYRKYIKDLPRHFYLRCLNRRKQKKFHLGIADGLECIQLDKDYWAVYYFNL